MRKGSGAEVLTEVPTWKHMPRDEKWQFKGIFDNVKRSNKIRKKIQKREKRRKHTAPTHAFKQSYN